MWNFGQHFKIGNGVAHKKIYLYIDDILELEWNHVNSHMTNTLYSSSSLAPSVLEVLPSSLDTKTMTEMS